MTKINPNLLKYAIIFLGDCLEGKGVNYELTNKQSKDKNI